MAYYPPLCVRWLCNMVSPESAPSLVGTVNPGAAVAVAMDLIERRQHRIRGASSEGEIAPNGRTRHSCGHLRRADTFSGMGVGVRPRRPSADSNTLCLSPPRSDVAGNQAYHCDRGLFYLRQRPGGARDSECPA